MHDSWPTNPRQKCSRKSVCSGRGNRLVTAPAKRDDTPSLDRHTRLQRQNVTRTAQLGNGSTSNLNRKGPQSDDEGGGGSATPPKNQPSEECCLVPDHVNEKSFTFSHASRQNDDSALSCLRQDDNQANRETQPVKGPPPLRSSRRTRTKKSGFRRTRGWVARSARSRKKEKNKASRSDLRTFASASPFARMAAASAIPSWLIS